MYSAWDYPNDNFLTIGEVGGQENICQQLPFDEASRTPVAEIRSALTSTGTVTTADKQITEGESVWFSHAFCYDGASAANSPRKIVTDNGANNVLFIWRFHQESDDLNDEYRTTSSTEVIQHTFDNPGIVNVTLMCIDELTGKASHIAMQQITIAPAPISHEPTLYHTSLSFSVMDTYSGRWMNPLDPSSNCSVMVDSTNNPDFPTPDPIDTGFEKYARVSLDNGSSWYEVWSDDIDGDEGWLYVEEDLNVKTEQLFLCDIMVEIGLRAVDIGGGGPYADRVRGVTIYVDDVYINNVDGSNALLNGSFETEDPTDPIEISDPSNSIAEYWDFLNENDFIADERATLTYDIITPASCSPFSIPKDGCTSWGEGECTWPEVFQHDDLSGCLNTTEVRSGLKAFSGLVKAFLGQRITVTCGEPETQLTCDYKVYCDPERRYNVGYYKAVRQATRLNDEPCYRLASGFDFNASPVPASKGQTIEVKIPDGYSNSDIKTLTLTDMQGRQILSQTFTGNQHRFNSTLMDGIYYVKIAGRNYSKSKKIAVFK